MALAKDAHGNGETLVVDQASVDGEDGHEQHDIPPCNISTNLKTDSSSITGWSDS